LFCPSNPILPKTCCLVILWWIISIITTKQLTAQYNTGETYFDDSLWVEYQAGDLPIILVSSHGGYLTPSSLPDRDCSGCKYLRDAYTQEITRQTAAEIHRLTGCYPHVIYNLLARVKLDANREIIEATDSSSVTEPPWYAFHEFIDRASSKVEQQWSQGLVIDIHGHAHDLQRLEMGTLLSDADLMLPNASVNQSELINKSSCRHLIGNNISGADHLELLRGVTALGSLLDTCGWPAIPSYNIPLLGVGEPHFNGGYITSRHGSRYNGTVDAIQIECNNELRWDANQRTMFADTLANKLLQYMGTHYITNFQNGFCGTMAANTNTLQLDQQCIEIYPDPNNKWYVVDGLLENYTIKIHNSVGELHCIYENTGSRLAINMDELPSGMHFIHVEHNHNADLSVELLIKN